MFLLSEVLSGIDTVIFKQNYCPFKRGSAKFHFCKRVSINFELFSKFASYSLNLNTFSTNFAYILKVHPLKYI